MQGFLPQLTGFLPQLTGFLPQLTGFLPQLAGFFTTTYRGFYRNLQVFLVRRVCPLDDSALLYTLKSHRVPPSYPVDVPASWVTTPRGTHASRTARSSQGPRYT